MYKKLPAHLGNIYDRNESPRVFSFFGLTWMSLLVAHPWPFFLKAVLLFIPELILGFYRFLDQSNIKKPMLSPIL
jgi:hypothetical protein